MEEKKLLSIDMSETILSSFEALFIVDFRTLKCEKFEPIGFVFKEIGSHFEFAKHSMPEGLKYVGDNYVLYEDKPLLAHDLANVQSIVKNKSHHIISFRVAVNNRTYNLTLNFIYYNGENGEKIILYVSQINDQYMTDDIVANQLMLLTASPNFISAYFFFTDTNRLLRYRKENGQFIKEYLNVTIETFIDLLTKNIANESDVAEVTKYLNKNAIENSPVGEEFHVHYDAHLYRETPDEKIYPIDALYRVIEIADERVVTCYASYDYSKENKKLAEKETEFSYIIRNTFIDMRANIIKINLNKDVITVMASDENGQLLSRTHTGEFTQLSSYLLKFVHPDDKYIIEPYLKKDIINLPIGHHATLEYRFRLESQTFKPVSAKYFWYNTYVRVYEENGDQIVSYFSIDVTDNVTTAQKSEEMISRLGSITQSLTQNYMAIVYVNNITNRIEFIKHNEKLTTIVPDIDKAIYKYDQALDILLSIVEEDDKRMVTTFFDLDHLHQELRKEESISVTFHVFNKNDFTHHTYRAQANYVGDKIIGNLVIGFECLDHEVVLRTQATVDVLTKVYNRQAMYEFIEHEHPFDNKNLVHFVMLMDCDRFKLINDNYGHLEGDKALVRVANVLKEISSIYPKTFVSRHGGDEFVFIASLHNVNELNELINNINNKLAESNKKNECPYELTISIGYCQYVDGMKLDKMISIADEQMYIQKAQHHLQRQ